MSKITEVRLTIVAFVYSIETDLKSVLKSYIVPYHENFAFFGNDELVTKTKEIFAKENLGVDPVHNISDFVEYLNFGDIHTIILKNTEFIPVNLAECIKKLAPQIEGLIGIRNRAMHSRPLLSGDFSKIYGFVVELREQYRANFPTVVTTLNKIEIDPFYVLSLQLPDYIVEDNNVAHNLPFPDFDETGLIGRKKDSEELRNLILKNQVVTLIGTGGIGKSALMLKVLYDIVDLKEACPFDMIIWVSAKTTMLTANGIQEIANALTDFSSIVQGIATQMDKNHGSVDTNIEMIMEFLELFDVLLVIDNLETIQTENIKEFIREAQMRCKIAITSRIGLGELEYRRKIEGLSDSESAKMIKDIARIRNSAEILRIPQNDLYEVSRKLHHNPLAIKWFVNSVVLGKNPNEVLARKDDLLEFCLSNIFDNMTAEGLQVLNVIRAARRPISEAEVIFLSELPALECRKGILDLHATTFVIRDIVSSKGGQQIIYRTSDFSNEYLLKYHPLPVEIVKRVQRSITQLNESVKDVKYRNENNEFGLHSLEVRNTEEKIASKLLMDALSYSRRGEIPAALQKIEDVKGRTPNYFEIYRISAFIKASSDDYLGADNDYKLALELEPEDARTLYYYAQFLLFKIEDIDSASIYAEKVYNLRPNHPYSNLLKARLLLANSDFAHAISFLNDFMNDKVLPSSKDWRIALSEIMHCCQRWASNLISYDQNYSLAAEKLLLSANFYEKAFAQGNVDKDMSDKLCRALNMLVTQVPNFFVEIQLNKVLALHEKFADQMALSNSYPAFTQKIFDDFKIRLSESHLTDSATSSRLKGIIVQFHYEKAFAFIDTGTERIFSHKSNFKFPIQWNEIDNGSVVVFDRGDSEKGPQAMNTELAHD